MGTKMIKIKNLLFFKIISALFYFLSVNVALANLDLGKSELSINEELSPDHIGNMANINISGEFNHAYIEQNSSYKSGNIASINQNGRNNKSLINQGGEANSANIDQYGNSNLAIILQNGSGNNGSISQYGNENEAILSQSGDSLDGSISQLGNGNLAYIVDNSSVSMSGYNINQSGQQSLIIINGMNRNISMTLK